jgi:hypothetical protein
MKGIGYSNMEQHAKSLKQFYKAKRLNVYKQKTPSLGGALLLIILFSF